MSATVVLVHGAWHGTWCWDGLRARLDAAGIETWAVDNPSVLDPGATLHDDADAVRALLDRAHGDVVLVGHSYGGAVVSDAGVHPAVRRLVFLTAFVLDEGESVSENTLHGGEAGTELDAAVVLDGGLVRLDPELAIPAFYHDCAPADAKDAAGRLRPQSLASFAAPARAAAWRHKDTTYALCTDDRAVAPALQRACAARVDGDGGRRAVEWPTSHSPFLSRPDLVAELLVELSR